MNRFFSGYTFPSQLSLAETNVQQSIFVELKVGPPPPEISMPTVVCPYLETSAPLKDRLLTRNDVAPSSEQGLALFVGNNDKHVFQRLGIDMFHLISSFLPLCSIVALSHCDTWLYNLASKSTIVYARIVDVFFYRMLPYLLWADTVVKIDASIAYKGLNSNKCKTVIIEDTKIHTIMRDWFLTDEARCILFCFTALLDRSKIRTAFYSCLKPEIVYMDVGNSFDIDSKAFSNLKSNVIADRVIDLMPLWEKREVDGRVVEDHLVGTWSEIYSRKMWGQEYVTPEGMVNYNKPDWWKLYCLFESVYYEVYCGITKRAYSELAAPGDVPRWTCIDALGCYRNIQMKDNIYMGPDLPIGKRITIGTNYSYKLEQYLKDYGDYLWLPQETDLSYNEWRHEFIIAPHDPITIMTWEDEELWGKIVYELMVEVILPSNSRCKGRERDWVSRAVAKVQSSSDKSNYHITFGAKNEKSMARICGDSLHSFADALKSVAMCPHFVIFYFRATNVRLAAGGYRGDSRVVNLSPVTLYAMEKKLKHSPSTGYDVMNSAREDGFLSAHLVKNMEDVFSGYFGAPQSNKRKQPFFT